MKTYIEDMAQIIGNCFMILGGVALMIIALYFLFDQAVQRLSCTKAIARICAELYRQKKFKFQKGYKPEP